VADPLYLGIDLGTTNSAAALFDGHRVDLVRNGEGTTITPSVVRIDARGNVVVGNRARRMLDRDPGNVQSEFKRLMGAAQPLRFSASGVMQTPIELSAEVLKAIRQDVNGQAGFLPERAVIGVPALFELPQTAATSEAARLAGFARIELIQEPVASAIAAGWKDDGGAGPWLVYDLGGGTFDVSLLETQEGLLRVVAHDGDNFLGGRDFDVAIVDWMIERIAQEFGVRIERSDPGCQTALRRLRLAAEDAKIELTRASEAEITVPDLALADRTLDVMLVLDRPTLQRAIEPLIMRSIAVCERLLVSRGIVAGDAALRRVVLVGGPTAIPLLRQRVTEILAAPFAEALDPMTLVAQGAALYAASSALDARPQARTPPADPAAVKVWLQYPAVSSDLTPFVVGKIVDAAGRARVDRVIVSDPDSGWSSTEEPVDAEGTFAVMTRLRPRVSNLLHIEGRAKQGGKVRLSPSSVTIIHGITIGDPPLARTVGVALANNLVRVFFERGSALPMRRTFAFHTVEALSPEDPSGGLRVPIVQGEFPLAHLCRLVGSLDIPARDLGAALAVDCVVDVTIEVDRGGRLTASARVAESGQIFDQVAHLVAAHVPIEELGPRLVELERRALEMRARAFRGRARPAVVKLAPIDAILAQIALDEQAATGGDADAAEKTRRQLVDLDALLADVEAELAWPELNARTQDRIANALGWVAEFGTPEEKEVLSGLIATTKKAGAAKNATEVHRQLVAIRNLTQVCFLRSPGAWRKIFDSVSGRIAEARDPRSAARIVDEGRAAARDGDLAGVERAVRAMWDLLPEPLEGRILGHGSGLR
jgi:molecular chaperone DnaK